VRWDRGLGVAGCGPGDRTIQWSGGVPHGTL